MNIEYLWNRSCPPSQAALNALRPFVACPPSASPSGEAGGARLGEAGGSLCFFLKIDRIPSIFNFQFSIWLLVISYCLLVT
ncbi:MAG: hypothetical protein KKH84_01185, partial [Proteobacteria bacterium]|nr:hypothetical protein [Pseudomonadota bacterium]